MTTTNPTATSTDPLAAVRQQQAAGSVADSTASSTDATKSLTQDYNTFITLLTTQLQNQDPLQPMDSSQFTQQLVQFSSVEQQIKANTNLTQLISLQQANAGVTMLGFIGKEVEVNSNKLVYQGNGDPTSFSYNLSNVSSDTTVTIKNSQGQVVRNVDASGAIGKHELIWDGKDSGGIVQPAGTYTVSVTATASDGSALTPTVDTFGVVTGVEATSSGAVLAVGDQQISANSVLSVREHKAATTTTASTSSGSSS